MLCLAWWATFPLVPLQLCRVLSATPFDSGWSYAATGSGLWNGSYCSCLLTSCRSFGSDPSSAWHWLRINHFPWSSGGHFQPGMPFYHSHLTLTGCLSNSLHSFDFLGFTFSSVRMSASHTDPSYSFALELVGLSCASAQEHAQMSVTTCPWNSDWSWSWKLCHSPMKNCRVDSYANQLLYHAEAFSSESRPLSLSPLTACWSSQPSSPRWSKSSARVSENDCPVYQSIWYYRLYWIG